MNKNEKSQKDVVFEVLKDVLGKSYSPTESMKPFFGWPKGSDEWKATWGTKAEAMEEALDKLVKKYNSKELVIHKKLSDHELRPYLKNLIFNWLNKDRRLNGNRHYQSLKDSLAHNSPLKEAVSRENWSAVNQILKDKKFKEIFELLFQFQDNLDGLEVIKAALVERVIELKNNENTFKKVA